MPDLTTWTDTAARAWFDHQQAQRRDHGSRRPDGKPWQWEDLRPTDQLAVRQLVLPVVTALIKLAEQEATDAA